MIVKPKEETRSWLQESLLIIIVIGIVVFIVGLIAPVDEFVLGGVALMWLGVVAKVVATIFFRSKKEKQNE